MFGFSYNLSFDTNTLLTTICVGELLLEAKNNVLADIYIIKAEEQARLSARIIAQVSSRF